MITIEALKPEDMPALLELYQELNPPNIEFNLSLESGLAAYVQMKKENCSLLAVAKENGKVIGSALGICCQCIIGKFLVIEDVIVQENQRGKGIGHMLMDALDDFAKKQNCLYSFLVSSDFRKGAHRFYEQVGYTDGVVGFRKVYQNNTAVIE